jgi:hypothetical protein
MENNREFRINDFYQAVILKTVGFPLLRLERGNGKFVTFVFDDPEYKAEEVLEKYWQREIKVIARDLVESINELKSRIYSGV